MPVTRKLPPLPDPNIQYIDPSTGKPTDAFYNYLFLLMAWLTEAAPLI